jgi:hypothetical protein
MICDEAHRLKNSKTSTYKELNANPCKRRLLLSGTPLQNDLDEFYAMVDPLILPPCALPRRASAYSPCPSPVSHRTPSWHSAPCALSLLILALSA